MNRHDPEPTSAETWAFLMPGLLHQLGNLLLTVQGHALTMEQQPLARAKQAILGATDRGSTTLRILHDLGGEYVSTPCLGHQLLEQLVELVRVPVREARQSLRLRAVASAPAVFVEPGPFARRVIDAIRLLLRHLPGGQTGALVLDLEVVELGTATVRLRYEPSAGDLPFPLATAVLLAELERASPSSAGTTKCPSQGMGVDLHFATCPSGFRATFAAGLVGARPQDADGPASRGAEA